MAKGPENTFISSVHNHLPPTLYRMKNHNVYNAGVADVWYSGSAQDYWVEYKFITLPKRDETVVDLCGGKDPLLSPLQQEWLKSRCHEGRNVAVVVGCKEGGVWLDNVDWMIPRTAGTFRERLVSRKDLAHLIVDLTTIL